MRRPSPRSAPAGPVPHRDDAAPMRLALAILAIATLAGCAITVRDSGGKHADGPGHSEKAPGQQKKK